MHPSRQILATILRAGLDDENDMIQKQVREYYARIISTKPQDTEYIKETTIDFCRKQNLKGAMIKSIGLLQNSSFDEIALLINGSLSSAQTIMKAMIGKRISKSALSQNSEILFQPAGLL